MQTLTEGFNPPTASGPITLLSLRDISPDRGITFNKEGNIFNQQ